MARKKVRSGGPDTVLRHGCILIADNAGFTRRMLMDGAAAALQDIWTTRRLLIPLFREFDGEVYKMEADNIYVFFDRAATAVRAANAAHALLRRETKVRVGIGIGFGELHYVSSEDDYYGPEVNLASKLGEDTAVGGETLLTEAAVKEVAGDFSLSRPRSLTCGGLKIRFRSVQ